MKYDKLIAFLTFGGLLFFALYYFKERMIFIDSAYYTYELLNKETFANEGRSITALPQVIPLILIKLGASLKTILIGFSVSFIIINILIYGVIRFFLKDVTSSVLLLLIQLVCIKAMFYLPVTEVHLSLSFSVLFFSWIKSEYSEKLKNYQYLLITVALLYIPYNLHPISIFPLTFALLFNTIDKNELKTPKSYLPFFALIIIFTYKFFTKENSSQYENELFANIKNFDEHLPHLFDLFTIYHFKTHYRELYLIPSFLLTLTIAYYGIKKDFIKLLLTLITPLFFIAIVTIMKYDGDAYINIEKFLSPINFLVCLPFITDLKFDNKHIMWLKTLIVCVIIYIGFVKINQGGKAYRTRVDGLNNLIEYAREKDIDKLVIGKKEVETYKIAPEWAISPESMILSTLSGNTVSIYASNDIENELILPTDTNVFYLVPFYKNMNIHHLNHNYFNFSSQLPKKITE